MGRTISGITLGKPVSSWTFFRKKPVYLKIPRISSTRTTQAARALFLARSLRRREISRALNQQMKVMPSSSGT